jgi:hypothetical protein
VLFAILLLIALVALVLAGQFDRRAMNAGAPAIESTRALSAGPPWDR